MRNSPFGLAALDASELCDWSVALAALAYWANVIGGTHSAHPLSPATLAASIFGAGAFNAGAWIMIAARCRQQALPCRAGAVWMGLMLAAGLLFAVPIALALAPALILLGLAMVFYPALPAGRREAGLLLLALGATWGWPFLRFMHIAAGHLDAFAVGFLVHAVGMDVSVAGNLLTHGNFSIEILPACASSSPLAGVALAYAMVALYFRRRLSGADLPWLAASLVYSIVLTEIRLSLMVPDWAAWNWWHNGPGVTIYELVALAGAVLFPWAASRRAPARIAALA